MKHILLAIPLFFLTPSCAGVREWLAQPATPEVQAPAEVPTVGEAVVDGTAQAAGTAVTVSTGNAALGLAVMTLVTLVGRHFLKKRQAPPPPPKPTTPTF